MQHKPLIIGAAAAFIALAGGCAGYRTDASLMSLASNGEFGGAREHLQRTLTSNPGDRNFILDRTKLALVSLADGVPEATEGNIDHLYDYLRVQGLNADRTVGSFFVGEGAARIWKGEPFEQAMGYHYVAVFDAQTGDWGNARAAANNSLFLLRDFSEALRANLKSSEDDGEQPQEVEVAEVEQPQEDEITEEARIQERLALINASKNNEPDSLGVDYSTVASDFEIGYLMKAIAARQLGLHDELDEAVGQIRQIMPRLSSLAEDIRSGDYNTVLVVDYGFGPEKTRTGPDGAIAMFRPRTVSTNGALVVSSIAGSHHVPVATDLNRLALDLKWNNLEDMRLAKSYIGTGMVAGGLAVAASSRDSTVRLIGLGVALAGMAMKATAGADTRHCELLPQRTYVALLNLPQKPGTIQLELEDLPSARLTLAGLAGPRPGEPAKLRYVRMVDRSSEWATSGEIFYSNDQTGAIDGPQLPYILGGNCVRTPSWDVLRSYQDSGYLIHFTLEDLVDLYREEGIVIAGLTVESERQIGRHILEGGGALYTPLAGTTGFARLFGMERPAYAPRSEAVRMVAEEVQLQHSIAASQTGY